MNCSDVVSHRDVYKRCGCSKRVVFCVKEDLRIILVMINSFTI